MRNLQFPTRRRINLPIRNKITIFEVIQFERDGKQWFLLVDAPDNKGKSLTNVMEFVLTYLLEVTGLTQDQCRFFEVDIPRHSPTPDLFLEVTFKVKNLQDTFDVVDVEWEPILNDEDRKVLQDAFQP